MDDGISLGKPRRRAAVVGAGLAGLTAAWRLQQAGFTVEIFERETYASGRTRSVQLDGCTVDTGGTGLLSTYDAMFALICELGLEHELSPVHGEAVILRDDQQFRIGLDALLQAVTSGVIGWRSKLALSRLVSRFLSLRKSLNFESLGAAHGQDTETLAEYCRRSFPSEVYEYLLNPALKFLYLHNGETGSVIELLWWLNATGLGVPRSLRRGAGSLADALASRLTVHTTTPVYEVRRDGAKVELDVDFAGSGRRTVTADACVVTVPGPIAASICRDGLTEGQRAFLNSRRYDRTMTVSFCTRERPSGETLMLMIPDNVSRTLATIIYGHQVGKDRAPPDRGIVNAYLMKEWSERHWNQKDDVLIRMAQAEVAPLAPEVLNLRAAHVQRWTHSAAISEPGDCARMLRFEEQVDDASPIQFTGDYQVQASMNVAVVNANRVARRLIEQHQGVEAT